MLDIYLFKSLFSFIIRQKNDLAEKAAMASALEKELKEATERIKVSYFLC